VSTKLLTDGEVMNRRFGRFPDPIALPLATGVSSVETFKSIFDDSAPDFVADAKFVQRLREFEQFIVNRSEEHIAFFGGQLTGVHPMRFRTTDQNRWFAEVLDIDDLYVEEGIKRLPHDQTWIRANDVFNLSCIWAIHRIFTSNLPPKLKAEGAKLAMQIMEYKLLGSLLYRWYPYPADEGLAQATLAAMSRKFLIKTSKSWHDLLERRAEDMVSTRSVHYKALTLMNSDQGVIAAVQDIQNRLKELMKSIGKIFHDLHDKGIKIHTTKSVREVDGSVIVQDQTKQFTPYIRYIHEIMDDEKSFIRDELVDVIADAMHTMNPKLLVETLAWMSKNRLVPKHEFITELVDETLLFAFATITSDRALYNAGGGLMPLLAKLRALYMASRMSNPELLKTKDLAEQVVKGAVKTKNASVIAAVRTGVQMYIVARALTMKYYQG